MEKGTAMTTSLNYRLKAFQLEADRFHAAPPESRNQRQEELKAAYTKYAKERDKNGADH